MKFRKKQVVIDAYQTDKELYIDTLEGCMPTPAIGSLLGLKEKNIHAIKKFLKRLMSP